MRIIFIGGGNIAEAIFTKLSDYDITVIDHNEDRLEYLVNKYPKIKCSVKLDTITDDNDLIFLAVKPQNAKESCLGIKELINYKNTIVSVMAGISTIQIGKWLGNYNIVRAMPNTPSLIGLGVSGIYFTQHVEPLLYQQIYDIFTKIGHAYILDSEDAIDRITAVSASSPAFVFYFIESMIKVAVEHFEFSEEGAKEIILQVMKGSIAMIDEQSQLSIAQLRAKVTSKNGTTEAGINTLDKCNFQKIINDTLCATYNRARELGKLYE